MAINTRNRAPIRHPVTQKQQTGDIVTRPWAQWAQGVDASITAVVGSGVTTANPLPANELVLGDGANAIKSLGSLGTTTTVYHGNAAGAGTFGPINLTAGAEVTGDLPYANLAQGSALSVLGVTGNATADNASIVAGSDHQVLRRSGTAVGFGAVDLTSSNAVSGVLPAANGGTAVPQYVAPFSFNNTQIKTLPSTYLQVVAAPGATKFLVFHYAGFFIDATAGAYTNVDTGPMAGFAITYGDWVADASIFSNWNGSSIGGYLTPMQTTVNNVIGNFFYPSVGVGVQGNTAFKFIAWNDIGDFTGGNAANTLKGSVVYSIFDFSTGLFV